MGIKNSDLVANLVALPQVANNPSELGGVVRIAQGNVALAAGDSNDNDIVMLAPIPTNATILSVRIIREQKNATWFDFDSATYGRRCSDPACREEVDC